MTLAERAELVLRRLASTYRVVVDTETDGLDRFKTKIVGWVFTFSADPRDSYYVPVRHGGGANLDNPEAFERALNQLLRPGLNVIGHNLAFDIWHADRHEVDFTSCRLEDTMINQFLLWEFMQSFSLAACCRHMNVQEKKGEVLYKHLAEKFGGVPDQKQMGNYWKLAGDDPVGTDYAMGDGTSTWQLREAQQKPLDEQDLRRVWDIECRLIPVLHRMSRRGIRIDEAQLERVEAKVKEEITRAAQAFGEGFRPNNRGDLKKLFDAAGITDMPRTAPTKNYPNGNASYTEDWLVTNEIGRKVVGLRKYQHLLDSFVTPLKERHIQNGRVYPEYNQTRGESYGTVTGRLSCSNPNMQQANKRNPVIGRLHRSIFVPEKGHIWGSPDLSQCEPRLLAHYSECKVLLDGYRATPPVDAHSSVAKAAGVPRQVGKTINQLLLTGGGLNRLSEELPGRTAAEVKKIWDDYFTAMPEINALKSSDVRKHPNSATNVMLRRGYVKSLLGRRARLDDNRFAYKAINRLLQCGNADIIKKAMVDIDEYLRSEGEPIWMLNNVHDSIDFDFTEEHRKHYDECLRLFTDFGPGRSVEILIPMEVENGEGPDWATATFGVEKVA